MEYLTKPHLTTSTHLSVKPTTLPISYFKFPPASNPATIPPPAGYAASIAHPFTIPSNIYNALLEPSVPITVALVYASVVTYLNSINVKSKKPWAVSQTSFFTPMVIAHNAFLAVYSAWTFVGMINAVALSFPGWRGHHGLAGALDSLCKINGPRGIGSAAFYNETSTAWSISNKAFHLAADGLGPDPTDVGRIWNEGLAFYGWVFYLSKFYEVIDTFIILSKGKKSSFLQTYHHAGAMLCMWAGIRYMSPPIWMFVLVNSGIHAVMYTFYFFTALGIKIDKRLKQTLTTLQITQFVIGATYAFAHLFVAYQIPVSVPYFQHLGSAISTVVSAIPSQASSATSVAMTSASAGAGAWLKKAALRAAGREGLAENVLNDRGQTFGIDAVHAARDFVAREETIFRDEAQWVHCLDTSGQVFAILLNCLYLAPLTGLFVRFFIKAYLRQLERRRSSTSEAAVKSFRDASKGFSRSVQEMHGAHEKEPKSDEALESIEQIKAKVKAAAKNAKDKIDQSELKQEVGNGMKQSKRSIREKQAETSQEKEVPIHNDAKESTVTDSATHIKQVAANVADRAKQEIVESGKAAGSIREKVINAAESAKDNSSVVGEKISEAKRAVQDTVASNNKKTASKEVAKSGDRPQNDETESKRQSKKTSEATETPSEPSKHSEKGKALDPSEPETSKDEEQGDDITDKSEDVGSAEEEKGSEKPSSDDVGKRQEAIGEEPPKSDLDNMNKEAIARESPNEDGTGAGEASKVARQEGKAEKASERPLKAGDSEEAAEAQKGPAGAADQDVTASPPSDNSKDETPSMNTTASGEEKADVLPTEATEVYKQNIAPPATSEKEFSAAHSDTPKPSTDELKEAEKATEKPPSAEVRDDTTYAEAVKEDLEEPHVPSEEAK